MIIKENTIDNGCVNVTIKTIRTSLTEEALSVFKTIAYESKYLQIKTADVVDMQNYDMAKLLAEGCFSNNKWLIGAYVDDMCIGGVMLTRDKNDLRSHRGEVHIALLQEYQQKGIGNLLLHTALKVAKEAGIKFVEANVLTTNIQAIKLFQNLGFQQVAYINDYILKDHQYYDTYYMIKNLNAEG